MKYIGLWITAFFISNLAPTPAFAQTNRAIEISIFGIGPAVDSKSSQLCAKSDSQSGS